MPDKLLPGRLVEIVGVTDTPELNGKLATALQQVSEPPNENWLVCVTKDGDKGGVPEPITMNLDNLRVVSADSNSTGQASKLDNDRDSTEHHQSANDVRNNVEVNSEDGTSTPTKGQIVDMAPDLGDPESPRRSPPSQSPVRTSTVHEVAEEGLEGLSGEEDDEVPELAAPPAARNAPNSAGSTPNKGYRNKSWSVMHAFSNHTNPLGKPVLEKQFTKWWDVKEGKYVVENDEHILWREHKLISAQSTFKQQWDVMIITFVVYNCIFIPLDASFPVRVSRAQTTIDYFIDALFIVDLIMNFFTALLDEYGEFVTDRVKIRQEYLHGWFPLDFLASFPFELVAIILNLDLQLSILAMLKMPRLLRLGRLLKKLDQLAAAGVLRIVRVMMMFVLFAHWVGCAWMVLGKSEDVVGDSWTYRTPGYQAISIAENQDGLFDDPNRLLRVQYLSSLYWALTTLIKTSWVPPATDWELVFSSCVVVLGAILFAALLGNVTSAIQSYDTANALRRNRLTTLHLLSEQMKMPSSLHRRMVQHVDEHLSLTQGLEATDILKRLPSNLHSEIMLQCNKGLIKQCCLFHGISHECMAAILKESRVELVIPGELLLSRGQVVGEVYIMVHGKLRVEGGSKSKDDSLKEETSKKRKKADSVLTKVLGSHAVTLFKDGRVLGCRNPYEKSMIYPFIVRAIKPTRILSMSANRLASILDKYSAIEMKRVCEHLEDEFQLICSRLEDAGLDLSLLEAELSKGDIPEDPNYIPDSPETMLFESPKNPYPDPENPADEDDDYVMNPNYKGPPIGADGDEEEEETRQVRTPNRQSFIGGDALKKTVSLRRPSEDVIARKEGGGPGGGGGGGGGGGVDGGGGGGTAPSEGLALQLMEMMERMDNNHQEQMKMLQGEISELKSDMGKLFVSLGGGTIEEFRERGTSEPTRSGTFHAPTSSISNLRQIRNSQATQRSSAIQVNRDGRFHRNGQSDGQGGNHARQQPRNPQAQRNTHGWDTPTNEDGSIASLII